MVSLDTKVLFMRFYWLFSKKYVQPTFNHANAD